MTREICKSCWKPVTVGFNVPEKIWNTVIPKGLPGKILCLGCFTMLADEMLLGWDEDIEFYPVSLKSHLASQ